MEVAQSASLANPNSNKHVQKMYRAAHPWTLFLRWWLLKSPRHLQIGWPSRRFSTSFEFISKVSNRLLQNLSSKKRKPSHHQDEPSRKRQRADTEAHVAESSTTHHPNALQTSYGQRKRGTPGELKSSLQQMVLGHLELSEAHKE